MSKILFLYTELSAKSYLHPAKNALKAIFKKFRKSVSADFHMIDLSPSCFAETKALLLEKVISYDGVLFCGNSGQTKSENLFFRNCFGADTEVIYSGGRCILSPVGTFRTQVVEETLKEERFSDFSSITKTAELAVSMAKERKNTLLLCTDSTQEADKIIYNKFTDAMSIARFCEIEHIEFDELIFTFAREIPSFDVLLCPEDKAKIIATHTLALNKFPLAYSRFSGDNISIYEAFTTSDGFSNLSYAAMIIALSGMIENDLGFKNVGVHLRKAVAHAVEKCCYEDITDFQNHLLNEIYSPIRKRRVKINETDN